MRHSEIYRQSYSPNQLNDKTEKRIILLYTSGQSVESIAREVGRARHRVVHLLQTKGLFGNGSAEHELPRETLTVEEPKEFPVNESAPEIARPAKPPRRVRSPQKASDKPEPLASVEKPHRWSPPVLDALCKVAVESNLYPGKSIEEVRQMVSDLNH
jgi:transposase-like protein